MENELKLIDFHKARADVMEILKGKVNTPVAVQIATAMAQAEVDAAPVVHGYWCNVSNGMVRLGDCSNCDERQPTIGSNYCRKCGAKMEYEPWAIQSY